MTTYLIAVGAGLGITAISVLIAHYAEGVQGWWRKAISGAKTAAAVAGSMAIGALVLV